MSRQANKGEWSEPYAALRIIGNRRIHVADRMGRKNHNEWIEVLALMRQETQSRLVRYRWDPDLTDVCIEINGQSVKTLPVADFIRMADTLQTEIFSAKGRVFSVDPKLDADLLNAEITKIKALSVNKSDIEIDARDPRSGIVRNRIGFSIKSEFGQRSTLFNVARASASIYRLDEMTDSLMNKVNNLYDSKGSKAIGERCRLLENEGIVPRFAGYPQGRNCPGLSPFAENLELLNPTLKEVIPALLWAAELGRLPGRGFPELGQWLADNNPCRLTRPEVKYPYMLKSLLYAAYCGMTASTLWNGKSEVNGGFIRVARTGDLLAFYALESDAFKEHLYGNCYLERPSSGEKHGDFGDVWKDENGQYFFKLNFSIRYK